MSVETARSHLDPQRFAEVAPTDVERTAAHVGDDSGLRDAS